MKRTKLFSAWYNKRPRSLLLHFQNKIYRQLFHLEVFSLGQMAVVNHSDVLHYDCDLISSIVLNSY